MTRNVIALAAVLILGFCSLFAGTTGKISGVITDAETGEGLPGVNIQLVGTELGGTTDADGVFIILNIPPGLYTVEFSFIGYQTLRVNEVRVNVDFTTRMEHKLRTTAVEMDAIEVTGERNPLVRQDLTNTQVAITSETIDALPVDQIREVIALQAGVVEDDDGSLHIRGGRSNEVAFQVNGISINNPFGNSQGVGLATNAVEEVSVSTGTFSAEYGNALSGVVNFVTKDGGRNYEASFRTWTGDHFSSDEDIFFNIDERDAFNNRRAEWTFGGPVPLFGNKLTFFTSGVYQNDNGHLYGIRLYNPEDLLFVDGADFRVDPFGLNFSRSADGRVIATINPADVGPSGDGAIVPMVTSEAINLSGKLTFKPLNNVKMTYDVLFDDGDRFPRTANGINQFRRYRFTPDGRANTVSQNTSHAVGLTHTLSKTMFYTLKVGVNFNDARTSVYEDPLDPRYVPVPNNTISDLSITPTGYVAGGQSLSWTEEKNRTISAKIDITNQILPNHELKLGGEVAQHRLDLNSFSIIYDENEARFKIPTPENDLDATSFSFYRREPVQGALYFLDKMELSKRFILNAGLRYEYLDTKALYNPDLAGTVDEGVANEENLLDAEPKHRVMPRISLSFPITSEGIIRFSYGIFYQNPTFRDIYRNPRFEDFDFFFTPSFGNPNLNPQRSIQYEMGLQQQFTDDIKMEFAIFYKDVNDLIQSRRVVAGEVAASREFNVITNISYANSKGFTATFVKRRSPGGLLSLNLDYTFQIGEGSFDDPLALAVDSRTGRQTEQFLIPLDFDRTHTLNGVLALTQPRDWSASIIAKLRNGTPYTPSVPSSIQPVAFGQNSDRQPVQSSVDLKLEKFFDLKVGDFSVFMQINNLFDWNTENTVFSNTGSALSNLNETLNPSLFNNLRDEIRANPADFFPERFVEDFYQREDFLAEPREVRLGISVGL
ncbi:MAG: TonB-dependent receptor [Calditrichota bacterium]